MSTISSTSSNQLNITPANTTAFIYNQTIAVANTEQSQALPANCKGFLVRVREMANLKISYSATNSGVTFVTVPPGATFVDEQFYNSQTLYFQSPSVGVTIEIVAYT